jgi:hypothetical protein
MFFTSKISLLCEKHINLSWFISNLGLWFASLEELVLGLNPHDSMIVETRHNL